MKRSVFVLIILALCIPVFSAEFLIYNKDHWMDALTQTQIDEYVQKYPNFMDKYDARYQRGDIVEVRPDGFYTSTLKGDLSKWAFRVVVVTGLKAENKYMEATLTKRRRYNILDGMTKTVHTVSKIEDITLTDKSLSVKENDTKELTNIIAYLMLFSLIS